MSDSDNVAVLIFACGEGYLDLIEYQVEEENIDINVELDFGMTPIFYYMRGLEPTLEGLDLFIKLGANLYHKLDDGTTLEEYIIEMGNRPFAKIIQEMKRERRLNYLKTELAKKKLAFSKSLHGRLGEYTNVKLVPDLYEKISNTYKPKLKHYDYDLDHKQLNFLDDIQDDIQEGGMMRQDFNVRSAFADKKIDDELSKHFDRMYTSYVPYESDTDDDEYYDIEESFEPTPSLTNKYYDAEESLKPKRKLVRSRRSAMPVIEKPIDSQISSNQSIFSMMKPNESKEIYVDLDPNLCEIIPFNCKLKGIYTLYTLIFEISITPIKYIKLKDMIINNSKISKSFPLLLRSIYSSYEEVIDRINGMLFSTKNANMNEVLKEYNLNMNIGLIQSQILDGNVYKFDTNIFMIETRNFYKKKYTLILDFNRESQKTELDDILRPDVTVTRCTREDSTNQCEGLTENTSCSINDCRNKIFV
tara:strand:+ start:623 stop:2044 length:1422 start_codon:yes stop_codon:yes gene_type:complete